jgi:hypothetical protein
MNTNLKPSDQVSLIAKIDPVSQAAGTVTTGWVSAADYVAFLAIVGVGAMTSGSTVDAKIQQAQDLSGTGAKDLTGAAITQLTKAGSDDNKVAEINFRADRLDINNGFTAVRVSVTVATAASLLYAQLFGIGAYTEPPTALAAIDSVTTI